MRNMYWIKRGLAASFRLITNGPRAIPDIAVAVSSTAAAILKGAYFMSADIKVTLAGPAGRRRFRA
jgi:hypothetical protein